MTDQDLARIGTLAFQKAVSAAEPDRPYGPRDHHRDVFLTRLFTHRMVDQCEDAALDRPNQTFGQAKSEWCPPEEFLRSGIDSEEELREDLAAIEHERWADWQRYCHKVLRENDPSPEQGDILERWYRQIETPYAKLFDSEKASDMEQVDRYWQLIKAYTDESVREARIDENRLYLDGTRRHYYPAGPNDPHIPLAQFSERIAELQPEARDE